MLLIADTFESKVQGVCDHQHGKDYIQDKLIELGDRSCRNNLRIDGVIEEKQETWNICKEKVKAILGKF